MNDKIKLSVNSGCIVFLGSMNAMPMMYAMEFKKLGYDVVYFVDSPLSNTLNRPENQFRDITYPYPDWVIEFELKSQMLLPFFKSYYARVLKRILASKGKTAQVIFFNGFFTSLIPYFSDCKNRIALSHGSDLDSWADILGSGLLANSFRKQSFFKFLPKAISVYLIKKVVSIQYFGFLNAEKVIYFPKGFNQNGDRVVGSLIENGVHCLERYDASFEPLQGQNRGLKSCTKKLVIFSGVRFTFKTFTEGNDGYSKGNDFIIEGLSEFYKVYPEIEVHFVEKGTDVLEAKRMVEELELSKVVIWHKEMKFKDFLKLYEISDICFDQVGKHWIGAVGFYALWLGKPLIANGELPVEIGVWPKDNPVVSANNSDAVLKALVKLSDEDFRLSRSVDSMIFAEKYLSPHNLLSNLFVFS